ncbi:MAG: MGMT family protein [Bacteroidetes bacterium]|nr:MGMT family protein [Bacteroidota bacterium]
MAARNKLDFLGGALAPPKKRSNHQSTDEAAAAPDFFDRVWKVVAEIPFGKVTTYGHIAEYLGSKSAARTVGWALRAAKGAGLPCHRVVNRYGGLSGRSGFGGPFVMEDMLRSEGIEFVDDGIIDIEKHLWIPTSSS